MDDATRREVWLVRQAGALTPRLASRRFALALSVLGFEREEPVIRSWNRNVSPREPR